jgi:hypothetical protein
MFIRFALGRWLLAAVVGCGLFFVVGAAQAAADAFGYTGSEQFYTVPAGVHGLLITATGGGGGSGGSVSTADYLRGGRGGPGAVVSADVTVNPGDVLGVEPGGQGDSGDSDSKGGGAGGPDGGGGGAGGIAGGFSLDGHLVSGTGGGGGGGATVITDQTTGTVLLEAGGGGGGGQTDPNTYLLGGDAGTAGSSYVNGNDGQAGDPLTGHGTPGGAGGTGVSLQQSAGTAGEDGPGGGSPAGGGGGGGGLFDLAIGATGGGGAGGSIAQSQYGGGGGGGAGGSYLNPLAVSPIITSDTSSENGSAVISTTGLRVAVAAGATPSPAYLGSNVTLTANVQSATVTPPAGDPTAAGTVTFQTGSGSGATTQTVPVNGSGVTTWTTSSLPAGNDAVNASYSSTDGHYQAQAPTVTEQIQPQLVKPSAYVADYGSDAISIYSSGASGRSLLGTISGSATKLDHPDGVVLDSQGDLYVANSLANTITEYAPGASGNVAPIATISGVHTGLDDPRFLALDSSDDLYVVNGTGNSVAEYAPGANGDTGSIATITNGINNPIGIAFDLGLLYVSNAANNTISAYLPNTYGNAAPIYTLQGANTGLNGPKGLYFNSLDQLLVANDSGGVTTYAILLRTNEAPLRTLTGSSNSLANAEQAIIDPSNNTLVVDSLTQGTLDSWAATATGSTAPRSRIRIGAGSQPTQIALDPLSP